MQLFPSNSVKKFQVLNLLAVIGIYSVILAGGIVRSTGSGMGCPDWPTCFGQYIPPTQLSQLPARYQEKYVQKRRQKNEQFAKILTLCGYDSLAKHISNDLSVWQEQDFNVAKTWTEYINRLIGMFVGVLVLLTAVFSFVYFKARARIFILSMVNLLLMGFQAWLGSMVVATNLTSWIITLHLLLALALLAISIYTYHQACVFKNGTKVFVPKYILFFISLALLCSLIQIVLGTEVRTMVDAVSYKLDGRWSTNGIMAIGATFYKHRSFAVLLLVMHVLLYVLAWYHFNKCTLIRQIMNFISLIMALQLSTGIALSYYALPFIAQALHVLLASLLFGMQFYLLLNLCSSVPTQEASVG